MSNYTSTKLPRELLSCICGSIFGQYFVGTFLRPIVGINMKPIPYQVLSSGDVVVDLGLNNPLVENVTIPSSLLIHSSITLPLALLIFVAITFPKSKIFPRFHDAHAAVCVLLMTVGMSEFIYQLAKMYVGRLRPNFYELCGFSAETLECMSSPSHIMESRQSFPSGHSSLSTSGMGVLALYFLGRANIGRSSDDQDKTRSSMNTPLCMNSKVCGLLALTPLVYSTFTACSRLVDNWHHPSDIVAGIFLGFFCSVVCYHMWYPSVISNQSGIPLSVLNPGSYPFGSKE